MEPAYESSLTSSDDDDDDDDDDDGEDDDDAPAMPKSPDWKPKGSNSLPFMVSVVGM